MSKQADIPPMTLPKSTEEQAKQAEEFKLFQDIEEQRCRNREEYAENKAKLLGYVVGMKENIGKLSQQIERTKEQLEGTKRKLQLTEQLLALLDTRDEEEETPKPDLRAKTLEFAMDVTTPGFYVYIPSMKGISHDIPPIDSIKPHRAKVLQALVARLVPGKGRYSTLTQQELAYVYSLEPRLQHTKPGFGGDLYELSLKSL